MKRMRKLFILSFVLSFVGVKAISAQSLLKRSWGMNDAPGVEAPKAWEFSQPKCKTSGVTVAVIDTGVDMNHPALKNVMWSNLKEINGKPGVDDDHNGFIDDFHGWDFALNSANITDIHGHGSHIAGIIAGDGSGPDAFKGVCPGVHVMSLRYYNKDASGMVNLQNTIKAIEYAVNNGADIINYSGGGAEYSQQEFEALRKAEKRGILVVAAAGNERNNADKQFYFPAAYPLSNILSVTAIDQSGRLLSLSNWGVKKVHVAAPGQSILSTLPNGAYGAMSGTSQATAYVSGVAAMLLSEKRKLSFSQLKDVIEESAVKSHFLQNKAKTGSRVNAYLAMKALKSNLQIVQKNKSTRERVLSSKPTKKTFDNSNSVTYQDYSVE